ncbi:MAG: helix-turn-helix domain-containing protein [Pirellulales bacterium]|nr:helix-turn-helix domain-containing protein [Pirellulales bacterium]
MDEATAASVRTAIEELKGNRLKLIFEQLDKQVSYEKIRIVGKCLENAEADVG